MLEPGADCCGYRLQNKSSLGNGQGLWLLNVRLPGSRVTLATDYRKRGDVRFDLLACFSADRLRPFGRDSYARSITEELQRA
jgi:hypothetical protein